MKTINAKWGPRSNSLLIHCECGTKFWCGETSWIIKCPRCGKFDHLHRIRSSQYCSVIRPFSDICEEMKVLSNSWEIDRIFGNV